jgi:hypothetical protein
MTDMSEVGKVFEIHTNMAPHTCPDCGKSLDVRTGEWISGAVNHVLGHPGWRLLHIGSEWAHDQNGASIHHTVAFLGHVPS